jgi:UDP-N-acetylglucosamine--N-acetylmuramyl-(pentapeptide) pyrophosphoryl-undecaprenol N-acetylglucosamine transferase
MNKFDVLKNTDIQIIWQTGKRYFDDIMKLIDSQGIIDNIKITKFIDRMDLAYKAADLVVARAGALTISELAILQKPAMLVPSPNVAEDHQTKNAQALVNIDAAILIKDNETNNRLVDEAIRIVQDKNTLEKLSKNIQKYAKPDADEEIVKIIKKILNKKK